MNQNTIAMRAQWKPRALTLLILLKLVAVLSAATFTVTRTNSARPRSPF